MNQPPLPTISSLAGLAGLSERHADRCEVDVQAWLGLLDGRAATPLGGPLAHDLLLPTAEDATRFGLNVFSQHAVHDQELLGLLVAQAERWRQLTQLSSMIARLPDGLRYHGGFILSEADPMGVLKIYVVAEGQPGLMDAALSVFGLLRVVAPFAIGFDLRPNGIGRARSYSIFEPTLHAGDWKAAECWGQLQLPGIEHFVFAQLDAADSITRQAKTSFDIIFAPNASLDMLATAQRAVCAIEPRLSFSEGGSRPIFSDRLTQRPVALEVDICGSGAVSSDVLFTIGEAL